MPNFFVYYLFVWSSLCLIATGLIAYTPQDFSLFSVSYWRFLAVPWKLITFAMALITIVAIAPYTGDPTWDYIDAAFMSVLAFMTAPWVLGILYQGIRHQVKKRQFFVACCLWMVSVSWSYDGYLLWRDGVYPATWSVNILASSVLYVCAGLLWNLDHRIGRGLTFSFLETVWFASPTRQFAKLFWVALPFMLMVACAILYFVIPPAWFNFV
jgi:hypothetical protein